MVASNNHKSAKLSSAAAVAGQMVPLFLPATVVNTAIAK